MPTKRFEHAVTVDSEGRMLADGQAPLTPGRPWTAEHLVLAALVRCTVASLRYSAERAGVPVAAAGGSAASVVARRDEDGRYAIVEVECRLDVRLEPRPEDESLRGLLGWAERGCFVGSSLTATPRYRWTVNGEEVA